MVVTACVAATLLSAAGTTAAQSRCRHLGVAFFCAQKSDDDRLLCTHVETREELCAERGDAAELAQEIDDFCSDTYDGAKAVRVGGVINPYSLERNARRGRGPVADYEDAARERRSTLCKGFLR
jgi:hypothetical protein